MANTSKTTKPHYVDNKKFYLEIIAYREKVKSYEDQGKEKPRIPNYIGECIWKIANRMATRSCYSGYSFKDEMIGDAIENCILYFDSFNPDRYDNPFAYFSQIANNAFLRRIGKEEKNRYTIYKNFQETIINAGNDGLLTDVDDNHLLSVSIYDNINEFMKKYEKKEEAKKLKRKLAKEGLERFIDE